METALQKPSSTAPDEPVDGREQRGVDEDATDRRFNSSSAESSAPPATSALEPATASDLQVLENLPQQDVHRRLVSEAVALVKERNYSLRAAAKTVNDKYAATCCVFAGWDTNLRMTRGSRLWKCARRKMLGWKNSWLRGRHAKYGLLRSCGKICESLSLIACTDIECRAILNTVKIKIQRYEML